MTESSGQAGEAVGCRCGYDLETEWGDEFTGRNLCVVL